MMGKYCCQLPCQSEEHMTCIQPKVPSPVTSITTTNNCYNRYIRAYTICVSIYANPVVHSIAWCSCCAVCMSREMNIATLGAVPGGGE